MWLTAARTLWFAACFRPLSSTDNNLPKQNYRSTITVGPVAPAVWFLVLIFVFIGTSEPTNAEVDTCSPRRFFVWHHPQLSTDNDLLSVEEFQKHAVKQILQINTAIHWVLIYCR